MGVGGAVAPGGCTLRMLRTNRVRYWLTVAGLLGFVVFYVAPLVNAFTLPAPAAPLPALGVPVPWFPEFPVPQLHASPTPLPLRAPARTPPRSVVRHRRVVRRRTRLQIVTER